MLHFLTPLKRKEHTYFQQIESSENKTVPNIGFLSSPSPHTCPPSVAGTGRVWLTFRLDSSILDCWRAPAAAAAAAAAISCACGISYKTVFL
jgi:hypothetical protein